MRAQALFVSLSILTWMPLGHSARADSLDSTFYKMYQFFDNAEDRPDLDQQLINSVRTQVRSIQDITKRFDATKIPNAYAQTLSFDAQLLQSALGPENRSNEKKILETVRDDLELKIRYESAVSGAGDAFRGKVTVSVRTKRGSEEQAGFIVSANPRRWASAQAMFPLGVSSPATGSLPPGIYQITVSNPGGILVTTQDVSIGLSGNDSEDVVMLLPTSN
jgi:hypothetical protein